LKYGHGAQGAMETARESFAMNTLVNARTLPFIHAHIDALLKGFVAHRVLYALAAGCLLTAYVEAFVVGIRPDFALINFFSFPILLVFLVLVLIGLGLETVRLARSKHEGALLLALGAKLRDDYFAPLRFSNAAHSVVCMTLFMTGFSAIKSAIPSANAFSWDHAFIELDAFLHFGAQPYEWLAPLLNVPIITAALNFNYNLWYFVMFGFCFWHGFARQDNRLRQHYLIAFMLTWFFGTCVLGTVFSSVGPGFYARLYPLEADPFAPLMQWLNHANTFYPVFALGTMDELWNSYANGNGLISGISAMPSMHVGSSVLFITCAVATGKRWLVVATIVFGFAILVGSVHLAWHYAVDGYLGAAVALGCWWLAGKLVDWDRAMRGVA
jgi:hypothetical protein